MFHVKHHKIRKTLKFNVSRETNSRLEPKSIYLKEHNMFHVKHENRQSNHVDKLVDK